MIGRPLTKSGGLNFEGWLLCILGYVARSFGARGEIKPEVWRDVYDRDYNPYKAIREHFDLSLVGKAFPWRGK